ncbi:MAG: class II fructose-bisphosphatase [Bryobacterales bacterium]|nr:class II fructose-bisphosphatase [Bryobacterales bacterium]
MEERLALDFVRVVEQAAVDSARTLGRGDKEASDRAAVRAMRAAFNDVEVNGRIVIGEGERDEAPMLYIGERVGAPARTGVEYPGVDIAVDPLEGTNLCAYGMPNAIAVLAAAEPGGLLHAPDCYMEKLIAGAACRGALELDAPVEDNLKTIARCLERRVEDLTVIVLDRPRHETLIGAIRKAGARIRLIPDGDLSAGVSAAVRGAGVHAVMGIGGAPEGVITAAALRCLHGEMLARLVVDKAELEERVRAMGIKDPQKIYTPRDLAPGKEIIFAASGVTEGPLLKGVQFFGGGSRTHSLVMTSATRQVRFLDTVRLDGPPGPRGIRLF